VSIWRALRLRPPDYGFIPHEFNALGQAPAEMRAKPAAARPWQNQSQIAELIDRTAMIRLHSARHSGTENGFK